MMLKGLSGAPQLRRGGELDECIRSFVHFMLFVNDDKTENNNYDALWPRSGSYCFQLALHFCLLITDETKKFGWKRMWALSTGCY